MLDEFIFDDWIPNAYLLVLGLVLYFYTIVFVLDWIGVAYVSATTLLLGLSISFSKKKVK